MIIPNILAFDFDAVLCDGMQEGSVANFHLGAFWGMISLSDPACSREGEW